MHLLLLPWKGELKIKKQHTHMFSLSCIHTCTTYPYTHCTSILIHSYRHKLIPLCAHLHIHPREGIGTGCVCPHSREMCLCTATCQLPPRHAGTCQTMAKASACLACMTSHCRRRQMVGGVTYLSLLCTSSTGRKQPYGVQNPKL